MGTIYGKEAVTWLHVAVPDSAISTGGSDEAAIPILGSDGSLYRLLKTDSSGRLITVSSTHRYDNAEHGQINVNTGGTIFKFGQTVYNVDIFNTDSTNNLRVNFTGAIAQAGTDWPLQAGENRTDIAFAGSKIGLISTAGTIDVRLVGWY